MKLRNSPENLEIVQDPGRRLQQLEGRGSRMQEIERRRMDWLLGLLIPLKWAVVLTIIYFVLTAIF